MAATDHYDLIVIGSGPGGASLAHRLAPTGKRILMLERGGYLPRSRANWDAKTVFVDGNYQAPDTWHGKNGEAFHPGLHYYVGGNSKVYGSALFRLREQDFRELQHVDGTSPAWPLSYDVFEPYYCEAEALFHVHGQRGEDPNEPWSSKPYAGGTLRLGRGQPLTPGLAHVRHVALAEAVTRVGDQLGIQQRHQRNGRTIRRLRQDAPADRVGGRPLRRVEEIRLPRNGEATIDDLTGQCVPGRGVSLFQHVVTRVARRRCVSHRGDPPAGPGPRAQPGPTR